MENIEKQISAKVFRAIETVNIKRLSRCTEQDLRPILPCLVRMSLITPVDNSGRWLRQKQDILAILTGIELVNSIVALLSIDFHLLEADVRKELHLRQKTGYTAGSYNSTESLLAGNALGNGLALEYERSDMTRRLRLVLAELLYIQTQTAQDNPSGGGSGSNDHASEFYIKSSELFDSDIYVEEIADVMCIALAELPTLLNIVSVTDTLLCVHNGPAIICRLVANFPDSFQTVCAHLIEHGERHEESLGSSVRGAVVSLLCRMNPWQALSVRGKCVEMCRMPALAVSLSLDHRTNADSDMVPFITGLLLGNDVTIRNWFALFIRTGQKRKGELSSTALQQLRDELMRRLQIILGSSSEDRNRLNDDVVVQASSLLRLYCALRGIGSIKFQDEEIYLIVQLITMHPNPSPAGVRFVSIGLCMLIGCSSLIGIHEHEKKCIEWMQWLVREEVYFESQNNVNASFGEMLLLMAIHFHSNQLSAICDLVCTTLGMKMTIRHNNMTRMKQIFTQEIFTEQVVTAHAVKVPVTHNLNANVTGFLPIHCIHQLLKSRLFAKHNVNIKQWIYRQICVCTSPLHPVLPLLVDAFVHSVVLGVKNGECVNKPLSEGDIRKVFQYSVAGKFVDNVQKASDAVIQSSKNSNLTPQLLLLYYLLLYEDMRLNNAVLLASHNRHIKLYSTEFLSELPIKYLLTHAQKDQSSYSTLFGPLLKLLATHFPHLTLTEDWLDDMSYSTTVSSSPCAGRSDEGMPSVVDLEHAFRDTLVSTPRLAHMLQRLRAVREPINIWPYAECVTAHARDMLDARIPRFVQELYRDVWFRLNSVLPRRLWVLTLCSLVDSVHGGGLTTGNNVLTGTGGSRMDIAEDSLQIMRCDVRVFRCAPLYTIVLRVLRASLASSRSQLTQHLQSYSRLDASGVAVTNPERVDVCRTIVAAQESAAIQMLLETCLETEEDRRSTGNQWALQEVRSMVCCHIHQVFIANASLAKLVHFQGYDSELLEVVTKGIPSMHICLDFMQELMQQPNMSTQIFAIQLLSHLANQYAIPRSLDLCTVAITLLSTMLNSVSSVQRVQIFEPLLPSLVRIANAFPPLANQLSQLLIRLSRIARTQSTLDTHLDAQLSKTDIRVANENGALSAAAEECFTQIVTNIMNSPSTQVVNTSQDVFSEE